VAIVSQGPSRPWFRVQEGSQARNASGRRISSSSSNGTRRELQPHRLRRQNAPASISLAGASIRQNRNIRNWLVVLAAQDRRRPTSARPTSTLRKQGEVFPDPRVDGSVGGRCRTAGGLRNPSLLHGHAPRPRRLIVTGGGRGRFLARRIREGRRPAPAQRGALSGGSKCGEAPSPGSGGISGAPRDVHQPEQPRLRASAVALKAGLDFSPFPPWLRHSCRRI